MRPVAIILDFLRLESSAGILLFLAAVLALIMANSPLGSAYEALLDLPVVVQFGALKIAKPLLLWVNDGLMAVFFLLVGMEVKREVLEGELSRLADAALPVLAAVGGMVGPALVFMAFNFGDAETMRGWAVPTATDIAFALGVLTLLGSRAPAGLKVFLLTLAIIDDLGAIILIAVFYTSDLSHVALGLAATGVAALALLNLAGVTRRAPYLLIGTALWVCVLKSGVHATLAGVATGLAIPLRAADGSSPLQDLEHDLHPWVAYGILPVFAFTNAGINLAGVTFATLADPVHLGVELGLLIGKPVGVLAVIWLAMRLGLGRLPEGVTQAHMRGLAVLTGIGFTMSLFIGTLAFPAEGSNIDVRLSVLLGSVLSALGGYLLLRRAAVKAEARAT
ncbi:MAG: Na+/H+ antiporter NhaA [Acetobacteraceae bacterium]|nr:Na+/H+ antiporter NhaA [Acetobacteraceae bacterium]